jgi:hypothetical protein
LLVWLPNVGQIKHPIELKAQKAMRNDQSTTIHNASFLLLKSKKKYACICEMNTNSEKAVKAAI